MVKDVSVKRDVVIGHSTADLLDAIETRKYVILNGPPPPKYKTLKFGKGRLSHESLWVRAYWQLFFSNLIYPGSISSIEIETENKTITLFTKSGQTEVNFTGLLEISSLDKVAPLEILGETAEGYIVEDYFNVTRGTLHTEWQICLDSNFVQSLNFYIADRLDGNVKRKDLVAVSHLDASELLEFEYSDTYAKFKVESVLSDHPSFTSPVEVVHVFRDIRKKTSFKSLESATSMTIRPVSRSLTKKRVKTFESQYNKKYM